MRNYVDGINPAIEEDQRVRRNLTAMREALREHSRALAKLIPGNNNPNTLGVQNTLGDTRDLQQFTDPNEILLSRVTFEGAWDGPITTLQTVSVADLTFKIFDDVDPTKILQFQCSGITTGTTRTLTAPDADTTIAGLSVAQSFTATQTFNATTPTTAVIINTANTGGFSGTGLILQDDSDNFRTELARVPGGSNDNVLFLPNTQDGELVTTDSTGELFNKTLGNTNVLQCSTAASGCRFQDITTSTKRLRVVLSGAAGANSFVISSTAARAYTFGDVSGNIAIDAGVICYEDEVLTYEDDLLVI